VNPDFDPFQDGIRQAQVANSASLEDDPEQAARAVELSDSSGVPASAIYGDVDGFEAQHKAALGAHIIANNLHIADYLNSHPMAPKLSNDDLGQLDKASQAISNIKPKSWAQEATDWLKAEHPGSELASNFLAGAKRGFGDQPLGNAFVTELPRTGNPILDTWYRLSEATARAESSIPELALRSINAGLYGAASAPFGTEPGERLAEVLNDPGTQASLMGAGPPGAIAEGVFTALRAASPWLRAGKDIPIGIHPELDKIAVDQAKNDVGALSNALKESAKSATRERSPDLFESFVRQHVGDEEMAISADAIRKIYGDKQPLHDDGLLGFIPNIEDQLANAEATGGDVHVSTAKFLANADLETFEQLKDNIRTRPGGLTLEEGETIADHNKTLDPKYEPITEPLPLVRGTAALEPLFSVGDRKVKLERMAKEPDKITMDPARDYGEAGAFHDFNLLDETGKTVGSLNLSEQKAGKQLYVEMIQAGGNKKMYDPNFLGPALIRDIARQLKTEFPNAFGPDGLGITGHRVSGAREKAGTWDAKHAMPVVKFDREPGFDGADVNRFRDVIQNAWTDIQQGVKGEQIAMTPEKQKIVDSVNEVLNRIAPKGVGVEGFERIQTDAGNRVGGVYTRYEDAAPWISWSLESKNPVATVRHEAIHFLRDSGRISPDEWSILSRAARDGDWVKAHNIDSRFDADRLSNSAKIEESIADQFKKWEQSPEAETAIGKIFQKIKDILDQIRASLRTAFGKENWEDVFRRIESGEVGERDGKAGEASDALHFEEGETDPAPFEKANALGMTVDQYRRYQKLMERRNAEDLEAAHKSALEYQRKTQTKEWKANRTEMRDQVREELESRPDLALDQLMSQEKLKFHPDAVSDAQREMLPKEYLQKKDGINPDDAAGYFGYHSGDAMVERLGLITRDRQAAGMKAREWLNHLIDTETDRRMQEQFGNLDQNILEDAKEQAISATQLDILHEEVLHLGLKAGSEFPISREQLRQWNKDGFDKMSLADISTDKFLRVAGKAGRAAEMALLKEDYAEAFREKQLQNNAMIRANYAKAYEKSRRAFDRTAKQFRKREVASVPQEWTNWIHDILQRTGNQVNRSVQDLAENIGRQSEKTLQAFAEAKEAETFGLRETPIADFLLDPQFRASMDSLTAEQFAGLKQSIDVLAKQGRDEKKITVAGETADRDVVLREMREKLKTFPAKALPDERGAISKSMDTPRMFMAGSTAIETIMNRWDRADPRGIFNRYISYPLARAANYKSALQREYAKAYGDLGPIVDGDKLVDAPFPDPLSRSEENPEGRAWPGFTRKHVLAMLQNAGNKSNWRVLARGYSTDPEALMAWLHRNTTKEDWDRAQKMGDSVFHSLVSKADTVYENLTGTTIEKIPLEPIETPYGTYPGWYHPLMADPIRKEVWVKQEDGTYKRNATGKRGSVMDDSDYFHASTANGYTKRRTGAVYPLDLNFDMVPSRIKQMIHDIAFRDTIIQTEKIFGNKAFQAEVTKHYGPIYTDLLMPYLRNMAGAESIPSKAGAKAAQISETLRQNVISTYIGFNPYTALKHGPTAALMSANEVGPVNFLNAVRSLYGQSPELGLSNSEFALKHSEELQRRERHWQDTIAGQHNEIEGNSSLREKIIEKGSWLVAQSDMLSAKPTWVASYNKNIGEGLSHGESVDLADRAVRRAHGSTAETNQPALVRGGGPLHGWLTSVYGFFGTAMQRRIEIAHQLNDTYQLGKEGEIKAAASNIPKLTRDIMTYVIWPTAVEEWVTGLNQDDRRGWGRRAIDAGTMGIASSVLYLRDLVHAFTTGQDPGAGLISSPLHDLANTVRDIRKGKEAFNRQHAGKTVGDILTVLGEGTGMSPKIIGNATRFGIDLVNKQVKPKGAAEYFRGITRGTPKLREVK
jgi:hypothetical protein